ncbi:histidine kinase [Pedobacter sp. Du54]|uniref:sensor histidine kinase n=1 Tax=Pedobacter anseongensis TaxID=3133439 RepID=UPI0030AFFF94
MKSIKWNNRRAWLHILCWSIYIGYEVLVSRALSGRYSHFLYYLFFYFLNVGLFYTHALIVMRSSFRNIPSSLLRLPLLLVLEMGIYVVLSIFFSNFLHIINARKEPLIFDWRVYISIIWRGSLFILFSTGYYFMISYMDKLRQQMQEAIEMERLNLELTKAQMDFLRSQINPHLLFNTLNFVKYAAKNRPDQADEAIIKLSEIMTFAMEKGSAKDGFVELDQELKQIENIISLNQLRFGNSLHINYRTELEREHILILPIVLLTLVENLFKHGDLTNKEYPGEIIVKSDIEGLEVITCNLPKSGGLYDNRVESTGLVNIISRLELTYGDRYVFTYGQQGMLYRTRLFVQGI